MRQYGLTERMRPAVTTTPDVDNPSPPPDCRVAFPVLKLE
jgi:hypothetical protein